MKFLSEADASIFAGKVVLVRIDANVPMNNGEVQDALKIDMSLPTLKCLLDHGAYVVVMSHMGRPVGVEDALSLQPVATYMSTQLEQDIPMMSFEQVERGYMHSFVDLESKILMLENLRFDPREEEGSEEFGEEIAAGADMYINDAFSVSHRHHTSIAVLPSLVGKSFAGFHFEMELTELRHALDNKEHPMCVIMGGAKVDTKIGVLERLVHPADAFLIGGGLGNTFLAAQGYEVGESYCQQEYIEQAREIMLEMEKDHDAFVIPVDVIVSDGVESKEYLDIDRTAVTPDMHIYDIGKNTVEVFERIIAKSKMIIWNGPMGLVEHAQYMEGTKKIARAIAANKEAYTLIGGGDTVDVLQKLDIDLTSYSYVSTSGGAMLEFMEKGTLPGIEALQ